MLCERNGPHWQSCSCLPASLHTTALASSLLPPPSAPRLPQFCSHMISDEREDLLATARKLMPLVTKSIANGNETKSLALMNSRSELDFELRLALLELGNDQPPSQDYERLSRYVHPLLEVLGDLVREDKDNHLKTGDPHQRLRAALARASRDEADSPELSLIRLPRTAKELGAMAQKMSSFRKANADVESDLGLGRDCTSTHHQMTTREGSHIDKVDESDGANKHHNIRGSETWSSRNVQDPNRSADSKVPTPVELQQTTRTEPQRQPFYEQSTAEQFMRQAETFYEDKIRPLKKKKAIKVAVLDTGVDKGEVHFRAVRGQRGTSLKLVKSFVGGDSHDVYGHGTGVAALIVEMAPHVDLYIAKVCVGKAIIGVDQYVEAIKWAMEHEVHIINISASMHDDESIEDAISKAEAEGIIVFAAASSDEANKPRAFPASMDKVLAIHATDGNGNPCKGNPDPVKHCANISTLGESIASPLRGVSCFQGRPTLRPLLLEWQPTS
ncbi:peptidase S8/S53 domain-containing protein [Ilyonectria destructans]|nr:peptidase S8/S53 domain-containing protein [Ilyonectria destructans]